MRPGLGGGETGELERWKLTLLPSRRARPSTTTVTQQQNSHVPIPHSPTLPQSPAQYPPSLSSWQRTMSSKRAATASASSLSASERVKAEPSHSTDNDVKPDMKPKLEDYIPSVTSISRNWLLHSDPAKLEALLLEECRLSPTFDSRVAASIQESATMLAGEGAIRDFRSEMDLIDAQLLNWSENENWEEIIGSVEFIALGVSETSPLLLKLNALKALSNIIP